MTRLTFSGATFGELRRAELVLEPGRYALLSNEGPALSAFVALAGGRAAPRAGRVLLGSAKIASSPSARAKIAALYEDEELPPAASVAGSVALALSARGQRQVSAAQLLERFEASALAGLAPEALPARERRSVALALALAHDAAELVLLHEPLTTLLPKASVLEALDAHTRRGALVLCATTSSADAAALGGAWLCLELGRVVVSAPASDSPRLGAGPWQELIVGTSDARALASALHAAAHELGTTLGEDPQTLYVRGPALEITAREVALCAQRAGLEITSMEAAVPPIEALLAARAGFARGAYEAARGAAQDAARGPAPPSAGPHASPPGGSP